MTSVVEVCFGGECVFWGVTTGGRCVQGGRSRNEYMGYFLQNTRFACVALFLVGDIPGLIDPQPAPAATRSPRLLAE